MHIVIIGNGIAGITAARFVRKLEDHRITVISGESDHFWSRTALMYIYMGHMRYQDTKPYADHFWKKNRIELLREWVEKINPEEKTIQFSSGEKLRYDKLLLATGSISRKAGWKGQDLEGVQGLYSLQDLEMLENRTRSRNIQNAIIVGGGLIGIELAEMLHTRRIPVTFLVREKSFFSNVLPSEESEMVNREIRRQGIDLKLETELKEISGNEKGEVEKVLTTKGETINADIVGLTIGVAPNVDFLKDSGIKVDKGILVDNYLRTNIPDVYAAGDCAQVRQPGKFRKGVEPLWYTGKIMGETAAYNLCDRPVAYDPGIWFNSAKFFDIEYQVYGQVAVKESDNEQAHVFNQGTDGKRSVRLSYYPGDGAFMGLLALGSRWRQEVCEEWIRRKTHIEEVLAQLELGNFDQEFSPDMCKGLREAYKKKTGKLIKVAGKRSLNRVMRFLRKKEAVS